MFVAVSPVQPGPRVPVACPGVGEEAAGPGPVAGHVAAPLHGPGAPSHAHPGGRLGARSPILKCLLNVLKGKCDYYF